MSRSQYLTSGGTVLVPFPGPAVPLSSTDLWVKSVIIQGLTSNTDFVYIGDSSNQDFALEPRRQLTVWGDNMDNGTAAKINLAQIYVRSLVNNEGINFTYLDGL